jgi:hypothetical protein
VLITATLTIAMEYAKHAILFVICFLTFLTQSDNFLTGTVELDDLAKYF